MRLPFCSTAIGWMDYTALSIAADASTIQRDNNTRSSTSLKNGNADIFRGYAAPTTKLLLHEGMIQAHLLQIVAPRGLIAIQGEASAPRTVDRHEVVAFVVDLDQLLLAIRHRRRKEAHDPDSDDEALPEGRNR
jgi:hypothetical protein